MSQPENTVPAAPGPVDRPVGPRAWVIFADNGNCRMWTTFQPHIQKAAEAEGLTVTPLFDQIALEAARDEGYAIGREAEAEYWRSTVERLTAQSEAWNARYMALLQQVADGRAMQPAPAIVVGLGPNSKITGCTQSGASDVRPQQG
jgi:hypothetical protein